MKLHCTGCGNTDQTIEALRARHPRAISCCPEREMRATCIVCEADFSPLKNQKTCSSKCSAANKRRRERQYHADHPRAQNIQQLRQREVIARLRLSRLLDRATRRLFAPKGEAHVAD